LAERVDGAALGRGGGEGRVDLSAVPDVAGGRGRAELVRDGAQPLEVAGEQRQRRAVRREALGDRPADPAAASGDDHVLSDHRRHRFPSSCRTLRDFSAGRALAGHRVAA
jgi:hypothetical protein